MSIEAPRGGLYGQGIPGQVWGGSSATERDLGRGIVPLTQKILGILHVNCCLSLCVCLSLCIYLPVCSYDDSWLAGYPPLIGPPLGLCLSLCVSACLCVSVCVSVSVCLYLSVCSYDNSWLAGIKPAVSL